MQVLRAVKLAFALLFCFAPALEAQKLSPVPGSIQDLAGQYPISTKFSVEHQIQGGTQGNDSNADPFAYWHAVQVRPWFHYDGIQNTTLTASATYIQYFNVPGTSNYKHTEWRGIAMGTVKQPLPGGSLYEQVRFELLNFRDSSGMSQHIPRLRFRLGQNVFLGEGSYRPYVGIYAEAIVQFPQPSYSHVHFQGGRFFAGYGFDWRMRIDVLLGVKAEADVSTSGSTVTLYYGPVFSIEYKFHGVLISENHKRTTAFKDF